MLDKISEVYLNESHVKLISFRSPSFLSLDLILQLSIAVSLTHTHFHDPL